MTNERLRRRLDALEDTRGVPTAWHRLVTPKEDMAGEEYEAWKREATAHIPPSDGVIIRRIVTPGMGAQSNGAGAVPGAKEV